MTDGTLTAEQVEAFADVVEAVVAADERNEEHGDHGAAVRLLRQLWQCGAGSQELIRFAGIIADVIDPEARGPK